MSRSSRSARKAGAAFESVVAKYLAWALDEPRIERRRLSGSRDRGDITGVMHDGQRVVVECKDTARMAIAAHLRQARDEACNDDATFWAVVCKRPGIGVDGREAVGRQLVMMSLEQYALLLNHGQPLGPEEGEGS